MHGEESSTSHDLLGDEKLTEDLESTREESFASFMVHRGF